MAIRDDVERVLDELSKRSGIGRGLLRDRFHRIKRQGRTPGGADANFIDDQSGDVYDGPGGVPGDYIGNVFNDF